MRRVLVWTGVAVISLVVGWASYTTVRTLSDTAELSQETVNALVDACETNREPIQTYFKTQLAESTRRGIDYYEQRFPDFPPGELRRLIHKQRQQLRAVVEVYDPTACADQYR